MSKGVSPIIATVLLLAMSLSVALLAGDFFPSLINAATAGTTDDAQRLSEVSGSSVEITRARYNILDDQVTVSVLNGQKKLEGDFTVTSFCEGSQPNQAEFSNLSAGEIKSVKLNSTCEPDRVDLASNNYALSVSSTSITTTDTSSWIQSASQEFESVIIESDNIFFSSIRLAKDRFTEEESSAFSGTKINVTEDSGVIRLES